MSTVPILQIYGLTILGMELCNTEQSNTETDRCALTCAFDKVFQNHDFLNVPFENIINHCILGRKQLSSVKLGKQEFTSEELTEDFYICS